MPVPGIGSAGTPKGGTGTEVSCSGVQANEYRGALGQGTAGCERQMT